MSGEGGSEAHARSKGMRGREGGREGQVRGGEETGEVREIRV